MTNGIIIGTVQGRPLLKCDLIRCNVMLLLFAQWSDAERKRYQVGPPQATAVRSVRQNGV